MIVEDDPGHSKLIEKNLRRGGLNNPIETFENGQLALDYLNRQSNFKDHPIAQTLLLLDLNMPVMNGMELLHILKQDIKLRDIPVIVLTSTDDQREIDECYSLGCNLYLPKPIEFNRFTEAMRKLGMLIELIAVPSIK
ncbi:response regulator [Candidatus Methylobacter oryzae]|uniref:Response regulator n=1 Tax=Candidatus Methylobacter oryzae TaxID=2497749 RepID=A0ABY3CAZ4_9GAMM|nr:response regulator [Candidatus Methylobacter oryzae]TRW95029.1 response regulator [Candidatus Methylobacter oryzae]